MLGVLLAEEVDTDLLNRGFFTAGPTAPPLLFGLNLVVSFGVGWDGCEEMDRGHSI